MISVILKILSELNSQAEKFLNTETGYESSSYISICLPYFYLILNFRCLFLFLSSFDYYFFIHFNMSHNKEFEIDKRIFIFF